MFQGSPKCQIHAGVSMEDGSRARQHAIHRSMLETQNTVSRIQAMRSTPRDKLCHSQELDGPDQEASTAEVPKDSIQAHW